MDFMAVMQRVIHWFGGLEQMVIDESYVSLWQALSSHFCADKYLLHK